MREYLGPADIANNVSMLRGAFDGTILVVEGITDYRLYGKLSDLDNVELIVAHSKDNAAAAVKELYYNRKDGKVLGIVDSDLDRVLLVRLGVCGYLWSRNQNIRVKAAIWKI